MTLAANTSISLNAHKGKKDAVIAIGTPAADLTGCAIWLGTNVPQYRTQINVGILESLRAMLLSEIRSAPGSAHMLYTGGNDTQIVLNGTPNVNTIAIIVGSTLATKQQTHFINRTIQRLIQVYLELAKKI